MNPLPLLFLALTAASPALAQTTATRPPPIATLVTEENQHVAFDRTIWQFRELAKKLPLDEPWPANGQQMQIALTKHQLTQQTPPPSIAMPAEIARDVYLIGQSGIAGNNLTYLIDCGDAGLAIIDPTYESEFKRTLTTITQSGFDPAKIRWVLNTHCHYDHAMADALFQRRGAEIAAGAADADAIEKATRVTAYYRLEAYMRPDPATGTMREYPRAPVAHRLTDGEELRLGNKTFHVIDTPGHTPGSVCFLLQVDGKNLLFSGDTVLYDGRLGWQGNPYADNTAYLASLEKLITFKLDERRDPNFRFDMLLPGHGAIALDKAYMDLDKALDMARWQLAHHGRIESTPFHTVYYRREMFGRAPTPAAP